MTALLSRFWGNRKAAVCLVLLLLVIIVGLGIHFVATLDRTPHPDLRFSPPSWAHPLGTDYAGRDVAMQLLFAPEKW